MRGWLTYLVIAVAASVLIPTGQGLTSAGLPSPVSACLATQARSASTGSASCTADGTGRAAVIGNESSAEATGGEGNLAVVLGDGSKATAAQGDHNTATVIGDHSRARAGIGA